LHMLCGYTETACKWKEPQIPLEWFAQVSPRDVQFHMSTL